MIARLERDLADGTELGCTGITLTIALEDDSVSIEASAADGRAAHRVVVSPDELGAVAFGLLASIPLEPAPETKVPPVPAPETKMPLEPGPDATQTGVAPREGQAPERVSEVPAIPPEPAQKPESPVTPPAPSSKARATAAFGLGTRLGLPTGVLSPDLELRGDIRFGEWVVSLSGRAAPTGDRIKRDSSEYSDLSVGALGGRLFSVGHGDLALTGGPRLGIIVDKTESATHERRDLWLQAALRYVLPIGERWRPAVGTELEASPERLFASTNPILSAFPSWSFAVRAGVVGGLL